MDKLVQCKGVMFDELTHSYFLGDKMLIGVTSLMRKHGLSPDYSGIPEATLSKAAARGTAIHSLLEDYDNGAVVTEDDNLKAYKKLNLKVISSEYLVSDLKTTATFIDKVFDDFSLGDIKTTSEVHEHSVAWQLSICAYLFEMQNPGLKVPAIYCIHIRNRKAKKIPLNRIPDSEVKMLLEAEENGKIFTEIPLETAVTEVLSATDACNLVSCLRDIESYKAKIALAESTIEEAKKKLYNYMKEHNLNEVLCNEGKFIRRAETTRVSIDSKALKEKEPEIFEKYSKESVVSGSISFKSYTN